MKQPEFIKSTESCKLVENTYHRWPLLTVICFPMIAIIILIRKFLLKEKLLNSKSVFYAMGFEEAEYFTQHYEKERNKMINNMLMCEDPNDVKLDFEKDYKIKFQDKRFYNMEMPLIVLNEWNVLKYYQQVRSEHVKAEDYVFISHSWKRLGDPGLPILLSSKPVFLDYLCIPQKYLVNEEIEWNDDLQKEFDKCLMNFDSAIHNCSEFIAVIDPHYLSRTWCCVELCLAVAFRKKIIIHMVGKHKLIDESFFEQTSWDVFIKLFKLSMTGETTFKKDKIFLLEKVRRSLEILHWQIKNLNTDHSLFSGGLSPGDFREFIDLTLIKFN